MVITKYASVDRDLKGDSMAKEMKETKPAVRTTEFMPRRLGGIERIFEDWFDDLWSPPAIRLRRPDFWPMRLRAFEAPALDVYEDKEDLIVKAEMPGLTKEELDITLEGNTLTIKGEKKKEDEIKEDNYYRSERTFGSFSRMVELPIDVKCDKVNASFKNGVLEIRLPKTEEAKKNVVKVKVA